MNKMDITVEQWKETKEKLKRKFALLSDSELFTGTARQEEVLLRLQIKLGKSKEEVLKLISEL